MKGLKSSSIKSLKTKLEKLPRQWLTPLMTKLERREQSITLEVKPFNGLEKSHLTRNQKNKLWRVYFEHSQQTPEWSAGVLGKNTLHINNKYQPREQDTYWTLLTSLRKNWTVHKVRIRIVQFILLKLFQWTYPIYPLFVV